MIPLNGISDYIEKMAAPLGDAMATLAGKSAKGLFNIVRSYPKSTITIVGAGAIAIAGADKVHDLYNITSEMRKRKVMKKQIKTLERIAKNTSHKVESIRNTQIEPKLIRNPLT